MAEQLIASLSSHFEPDKFHDEYRERVIDLIERKAAGEQIEVQPQAEEAAPAPDLMAALEASLAAVQSGDSDGATPKKKAAAKPKRSSSSASGSKSKTKAAR